MDEYETDQRGGAPSGPGWRGRSERGVLLVEEKERGIMAFDALFDPEEQDVSDRMHLHRRAVSEEHMRTFEAQVAAIFEAFGLDLHTPATERTPQRFLC